MFYFSADVVHGDGNFKRFFANIGWLNAGNLTRIIISMIGIMVADDPLAGKDGRFTCSQRSYDMMETIKKNCLRPRMFVVMMCCIPSSSPSPANWLHLDLHQSPNRRDFDEYSRPRVSLVEYGRPKIDRPWRAIPLLDGCILAPSDTGLEFLSPKMKDLMWSFDWEVYDSYSEYAKAYQYLFPPGQPDLDTLECELWYHDYKEYWRKVKQRNSRLKRRRSEITEKKEERDDEIKLDGPKIASSNRNLSHLS